MGGRGKFLSRINNLPLNYTVTIATFQETDLILYNLPYVWPIKRAWIKVSMDIQMLFKWSTCNVGKVLMSRSVGMKVTGWYNINQQPPPSSHTTITIRFSYHPLLSPWTNITTRFPHPPLPSLRTFIKISLPHHPLSSYLTAITIRFPNHPSPSLSLNNNKK